LFSLGTDTHRPSQTNPKAGMGRRADPAFSFVMTAVPLTRGGCTRIAETAATVRQFVARTAT
jgi:hypothetical protein